MKDFNNVEKGCLENALMEKYYRTMDLGELSLIEDILNKLGVKAESEFINAIRK